MGIIVVCFGVGAWAVYKSSEVRIGDTQAGVPELRQDSRYNVDSRLITSKFSIGIDILSVQEIKGWSGATPLPESPPCLLGVINLRGRVVPIIDLRRRFNLFEADFGPTTVVVVARVDSPDGTRIAPPTT